MMKCLLFAILTLGCLGAAASPAYACFCVTPEVPAALKQAQAVFLGDVVEIIEPKDSNESASTADRFFTIRFKIHKSWKGIALGTQEFDVLSAPGRYGCFAYPSVSKGERYLVYADPGPDAGNWSYITICNRTTVVRPGPSPHRLSSHVIDPFEDIRHLDAITALTFSFDRALRLRSVLLSLPAGEAITGFSNKPVQLNLGADRRR